MPTGSAVSDCVDAAVEAMQTPSSRTLVRGLPRHPRLFELSQRHHPLLPRRDTCHAVVGGVAFVAHMATKSTEPPSSPPYPAAFGPPVRLRRGATRPW